MKDENGPLIALVFFIVLSILFGFFAYQHYTELVGDEQQNRPSMDKKIQEKRHDLESLKADIESNRSKAEVLRREIRKQVEIYSLNAANYEEFTEQYTRRLKLLETAAKFDQNATDLSGQIAQLKSGTLTSINKMTSEVREKMDKELTEIATAKDQSLQRQRQILEEGDAEVKRHRDKLNYQRAELVDSKSVLKDLTSREVERATIFNEPDGKVVLADNVHNLVVIDIGTSSGVKNGFRFEVFVLKPGNRKQVKGYLEVRRADPTKSECMLIRTPVQLPKDSLSEYVADQPEEKFSPYQQSGNKDFTAQPLTGVSRPVVLGYDPMDPIVEGDLIQNPFYTPNKTFTYYLAGSKEMIGERQKSAIRYRWTEIKSVAESYGNKVLPAVDVNVNFIIAQKNAKTDDPEFQKGVDLGIPVIYEWELFRFLDTK